MSPLTPLGLRAAQRTLLTSTISKQLISRRGFHATSARLSSPYHYPEGPLTSVPFNTRTRFFAFRFWGFMATGFGLPFLIAIWQTYKPKA